MNFKTVVETGSNIYFDVYKFPVPGTFEPQITIEWAAVVDARNDRIESIDLTIKSVSGHFFFTPEDDLTEEQEQAYDELDNETRFVIDDFEVEEELCFDEMGALRIGTVDVMFDTQKITIS